MNGRLAICIKYYALLLNCESGFCTFAWQLIIADTKVLISGNSFVRVSNTYIVSKRAF